MRKHKIVFKSITDGFDHTTLTLADLSLSTQPKIYITVYNLDTQIGEQHEFVILQEGSLYVVEGFGRSIRFSGDTFISDLLSFLLGRVLPNGYLESIEILATLSASNCVMDVIALI